MFRRRVYVSEYRICLSQNAGSDSYCDWSVTNMTTLRIVNRPAVTLRDLLWVGAIGEDA